MQVLVADGTTEVVLFANNKTEYGALQFLPEDTGVLFTSQLDEGPLNIYLMKTDTGATHQLVEGSDPRVTSSGHLLFFRDGAIWAAPFDQDQEKLSGQPVDVLRGMKVYEESSAQYAVSANGTLVYQPDVGESLHQLVWVSKNGNEELVDLSPQIFWYPRLNQDKVTFTRGPEGLFTYSLTDSLYWSPLTADPK